MGKFHRSTHRNIYVRTQKAGERVMGSIAGFITKKLKLKVNGEKSAVDKAHKRKFLGFMLRYVKGNVKIGISPESFDRVKNRIRAITSRNQGNIVWTLFWPTFAAILADGKGIMATLKRRRSWKSLTDG